MSITVLVRLTPAAAVAANRQPGDYPVALDTSELTDRQRDLCTRFLVTDHDGVATLCGGHIAHGTNLVAHYERDPSPLHVSDLSQDGIARALDELAAKHDADTIDIDARREKLRMRLIEDCERFIEQDVSERIRTKSNYEYALGETLTKNTYTVRHIDLWDDRSALLTGEDEEIETAVMMAIKEAEAHARMMQDEHDADLAAKKESAKAASLARAEEHAASEARRLAQLDEAVERLGSDTLRKKWKAGLAKRSEAIDLIRAEALAPVEKYCPWPDNRDEVDFGISDDLVYERTDKRTLTDDEFERLEEIREALGDLGRHADVRTRQLKKRLDEDDSTRTIVYARFCLRVGEVDIDTSFVLSDSATGDE